MTENGSKQLPDALAALLPEERFLLPLALRCLDEKKAERLLVYDIHEEGSYSDYVIICHGTSDRQVQALADHVQETLNQVLGELPLGTEGEQLNHWRLLDYGGTVINVFYEPLRDYYNLEGIWAKKPGVEIEPLIEAFNEVEQAGDLPERKSRKQTHARRVDGMRGHKF